MARQPRVFEINGDEKVRRFTDAVVVFVDFLRFLKYFRPRFELSGGQKIWRKSETRGMCFPDQGAFAGVALVALLPENLCFFFFFCVLNDYESRKL